MSGLNIKQTTKDLSVCSILWRLWCSNDLIHSYRCPTLNPILGPVLGKWAWSVNLDITNNLWCFFNDSFIYFCWCCHCLCSFASKGLYQSFTKTVIPSCSWQKKRWLLRKIRKTKILCRLSKAASFRYEVGKLWY